MCEEYCGKASWWLQAKDAPMIEKSWTDVDREEQEYFALASDLAKVKLQNKKLIEVIKLILETDALQDWAFEDPDGDGSIAQMAEDAIKSKISVRL
jgi:hypothetical protein